MGFRENLLQKIKINHLADQVLRSLGPSDPPGRIDRESMRALLKMSAFQRRHERDLELYYQGESPGKQLILVLDNELKLYNTTIADVALRKSPTVKEMVSIRNAIKILNDKDVVVSRKADTLKRVQKELIDALDLSFTPADLNAMAQDGLNALGNHYAEGVIECITLFAELLGYQKAPKAFALPHHHMWGVVDRSTPAQILFGPLVIYGLVHNHLKLIHKSISNVDKVGMQHLTQIATGKAEADLEGAEVLNALKKMAMQQASHSV